MGRYLRHDDVDDEHARATLVELADLAAIWHEHGGYRARSRPLGTGYYVPESVEGWSEATNILGLTAQQRKKFTAAERKTLRAIQDWLDDQIALYERKIARKKKKYQDRGWKFTNQDVAAEKQRIADLTTLEADLSAALKAGLSHKSALLILARVIDNEAGAASKKAKRAIAYAYLNMVGTMRAPKGAEISGYQALSSYWSGLPDDTSRLSFLRSYAVCLAVADGRLDDSAPVTNDPTRGAIRWVSPAGLKPFDPTRDAADFYSRTYQGVRDRRFPKWARDPSDPEVARMQQAGSLASNYDEFAIASVPSTQFLFYVGVK